MKYVAPEESRTKNGNLRYLDTLRTLAKQNRNNPTEAEKVFWKRLKNNKHTFLRQKSVSRFILDFYCSKLLLAIEIDGGSHNDKQYYDQGRDEILNAIGIKTYRFTNEIVLNNTDMVFKKLDVIIKEREIEINK